MPISASSRRSSLAVPGVDGRARLRFGIPRLGGWRERLLRFLTERDGEAGFADHGRIGHYTLALTRWVAVIGQLFTVLFVHFSLGIPLPLSWLLPAIAASILVNITLGLVLGWSARLSERAVGLLFLFDLAQLAWLLHFTGGLANPFALLMLVPVALAAGQLGRNWTVVVGLTAIALATLLALTDDGLPWFDGTLAFPPLYRVAVWTGFLVGTVLLATYTFQFAEEARRRASALVEAQLALAREREMSALGSQAAAAAHMLGSPLATITVAAREVLSALPEDHPLREDVACIVQEAERCREILRGLGRHARDRELARLSRIPLSHALADIAEEWGRPGITVEVETVHHDDTPEPEVTLPPELRHAFANLIENACEFATSRVEIQVELARTGITVTIEDDGPGFAPDILDWLGEPYVSTRRGEGGLGLGVFIAKTLLERTGARIQFANGARGARVCLHWPEDRLQRAIEEETP